MSALRFGPRPTRLPEKATPIPRRPIIYLETASKTKRFLSLHLLPHHLRRALRLTLLPP